MAASQSSASSLGRRWGEMATSQSSASSLGWEVGEMAASPSSASSLGWEVGEMAASPSSASSLVGEMAASPSSASSLGREVGGDGSQSELCLFPWLGGRGMTASPSSAGRWGGWWPVRALPLPLAGRWGGRRPVRALPRLFLCWLLELWLAVCGVAMVMG